MIEIKKTTTFSAISTIEIGGESKVVAYFNAKIENDGKNTFTQSIQDEQLYRANREQIKKEREQFENEVEEFIENNADN